MMAMLAAAFVYANLAACSKQEAPQSASDLTRFAHGGMARLAIMADAPAMSAQKLRDAAGAETDLARLTRGQVSVVNLWATFCAPCKTEMPTLGALQRRFGDRIRVIAVSADDEGKVEEAKAELAELTGGVLPFYVDNSRAVIFDARAPGLPLTLIYNRRGEEVARVAGAANWDSEEARGLIEAVLAEE
ncbi:MAG: TlpA disulfide reductase family protein [Terricaulis sp.]